MDEEVKINSLQPKTTLEIRDLGYLTTLDEVQEADKRSLDNVGGKLKIILIETRSRRLRMTIV